MNEPSRLQKRKAKTEAKKLNAVFINIIRNFNNEIQALDATKENGVPLEDSSYNLIYKKYLNRYESTVVSMVNAGKFKYNMPDKKYFERKYNPINGEHVK